MKHFDINPLIDEKIEGSRDCSSGEVYRKNILSKKEILCTAA